MKTHDVVLLAGDALAVIAFVIVGQAFHNTLMADNAAMRAVAQMLAIGVPFLLLARLLNAYPPQAPATWRDAGELLLRSALALAFAALASLFIRAWLLGQPTVLMAFVVPALAFSAMFVLGWRAAFAAVSVLARQRQHLKQQPA
jgi:hypothetical protein